MNGSRCTRQSAARHLQDHLWLNFGVPSTVTCAREASRNKAARQHGEKAKRSGGTFLISLNCKTLVCKFIN